MKVLSPISPFVNLSRYKWLLKLKAFKKDGVRVEDLTTLVMRAGQGDSAAYEQIVHRFQDMAVGYAFALLGDWQGAEDAAQEAFISAYYALAKLRDAAAFPGWFRRIVWTQANRCHRIQQPVMVSWEQVSEVALTDTTSDIERRETRDEIYAAVHALPEHQRSVILLYYMGSHSQQEIATFLEIPVATVKTRLHHARKQLRMRISTLNDLPSQRPSRDNQFTEKVMRLFEATKSGDTDRVKMLLLEDASLARSSGTIQTALWGADAHALHVAVMHGRKDIVELLLAHGADINGRDEKYHFTALIHAIDLAEFMPDYAALNMVDFLLERGAEKDVWACWWMGDKDGVKAWLDKDPSLVNQIGPGPSTLLSFTSDIESIDFLLGYGANPLQTYDRPGYWGRTSPLREMAYRGKFEAVRHLLTHAAIEPDVFLGSIMGDVETVQVLVKANPQFVRLATPDDHILGAGLTALHLAAQAGHVDLVKWLLAHEAYVNTRGYKGFTPLHFVIRFGPRELFDPLPSLDESTRGAGVYHMLTEIPRLLIEHGADLSVREDESHLTPLGLATSKLEDETDRSDLIALLESAGAAL